MPIQINLIYKIVHQRLDAPVIGRHMCSYVNRAGAVLARVRVQARYSVEIKCLDNRLREKRTLHLQGRNDNRSQKVILPTSIRNGHLFINRMLLGFPEQLV